METVVSKWGNSSAVRIPKQYLIDLGIKENDKVQIKRRGNAIFIEKLHKDKSLRELVEEKSGVSFDTYLGNNPYDHGDYLEFGKAGGEQI